MADSTVAHLYSSFGKPGDGDEEAFLERQLGTVHHQERRGHSQDQATSHHSQSQHCSQSSWYCMLAEETTQVIGQNDRRGAEWIKSMS